eukprot:436185-Pyramimonas_sp.AAC.1
MPRNTLLASRVSWASWASMVSLLIKRDAPTPKIRGRPGASGLGFLWMVPCGRAPTVLRAER